VDESNSGAEDVTNKSWRTMTTIMKILNGTGLMPGRPAPDCYASGALPLNFHATNPLTHRMTSGFSGWDDAKLMRSLSLCAFLTRLSKRPRSESGTGGGGKGSFQRRRSFILPSISTRNRMSLTTDTSPSVQGRKGSKKKSLTIPTLTSDAQTLPSW